MYCHKVVLQVQNWNCMDKTEATYQIRNSYSINQVYVYVGIG